MLPITLAADGPAPHSYVIHRHTNRCAACNHFEQWSAVYAKTHLRSTSGKSYVTNLRPVTQIEWNVPIEVIHAKSTTTPLCFACADSYPIARHPKPPLPDSQPARDLENTDLVRNSPLHPDINSPTPRKTKTVSKTFDQLLDDVT